MCRNASLRARAIQRRICSHAGHDILARAALQRSALARTNPNGSESRDAIDGQLPTGERVAVHESVQPAGVPPNPAHRIEHSEIICVREGTVEFMHDGVTDRASAGDVLLVAKGTMHSLRNIGSGPAAYFVVAVGGDTAT